MIKKKKFKKTIVREKKVRDCEVKIQRDPIRAGENRKK